MPQLSVEVRKTPAIYKYAIWALATYVGIYLALLIAGWFDLARLPWSSHEHHLLYDLFIPLEWLRHMLQR